MVGCFFHAIFQTDNYSDSIVFVVDGGISTAMDKDLEFLKSIYF